MSWSARKSWNSRVILSCVAFVSLLSLSATAASAERVSSFGTAPLYFESYQSGGDGTSRFIARGQDCSVLLEPTSAFLYLSQRNTTTAESLRRVPELITSTAETRIVSLSLLGAASPRSMSGRDPMPGKANYLLGADPAQWRKDVSLFSRVQVDQVYSGIDLVYYADQSARLEYDFVLHPGAKVDQIALRLEGADSVRIDALGDLVLKLGSEEVRQHKPVIYQDINGSRKLIAGNYRLISANTVGFQIGDYDRTAPLTIDPVLTFSTYLGGKKTENGWGIAVDNAGNIYVAGETVSKDLPTTPGAYTNEYGGGRGPFGDAFVAKYDGVSSNLVYLTYFGGRTDDAALAIDVDKTTGEVYLTGFTDSKDFPIVPMNGAIRTNFTGRSNNAYKLNFVDAFVTKLDASGSGIIFSTLIGGEFRDTGTGIIAKPPYVYVCGMTESKDFVPVPNGYLTNLVFQQDAFVVKLIGGTNYVYSSYLGGSNYDFAESIAVDALDQVYVTGFTTSTNFPTTNALVIFNDQFTNGFTLDHLNMQEKKTTDYDGFATKFSADGMNLVYSTYLGGTNNEAGYHIAVDSAQNAYVTGFTTSKYYPTNRVAQPVGYEKDYNSHVFVTKIGPNGGSDVPYSLAFGSKRTDQGTGIAVDDATGYAYVTGFTSQTNFFAPGAFTDLRSTNATTHGPSSNPDDAFIAVLSPDGSSFVGSNSVFYGGYKNDEAYGIALQTTGSNVVAYIVGRTTSNDLPLTNAPQTILGNGKKSKGIDAFVGKIVWP